MHACGKVPKIFSLARVRKLHQGEPVKVEKSILSCLNSKSPLYKKNDDDSTGRGLYLMATLTITYSSKVGNLLASLVSEQNCVNTGRKYLIMAVAI